MTDNHTTSRFTFAQAEEVLAASLDGYQRRPQQQRLAAGVEEALANRHHLIAEAGCGAGKSFATAIPAIGAGMRTVMSTATKALQDQVANKDLPFLQEHLGVPFTFALLKGRSNYLCQAALYGDDADSLGEVAVQIRQRDEDEDFGGERDDLGFEIDNRAWAKVTVTSEECVGKDKCPFGSTCYAEAAKARAKVANVVVVNHALLLTDLKVRQFTAGNGSMLGEYDALMIDEAHEFEDYAVSAFSTRTTQAGLIALSSEVRNWVLKYHLEGEAMDATTTVLGAASALWETLEPGRIRPATILENEDAWVDLAVALNDLATAIAETDLGEVERSVYEKAVARKGILANRARQAASTFVDIATASDEELVRWVEDETTHRGEVRRTIKSAPVDVSKILRPALFSSDAECSRCAGTGTWVGTFGDEMTCNRCGGSGAKEPTPVILVSATLAVGGTFDYVAGRLGIDQYESLNVGTPFDFEEQARLYIPRTLPAPAGDTRDAWGSLVATEMLDLVKASRGRALLLFTSIKQMTSVYEMIGARIEAAGYTTYRQGTLPNKVLAQAFKEDIDGVLFATRSFFTGVDFPGETLSLVVIDKLPFPVPTEPLTEARTEAIERRGESSFNEYVIPVMSLVLAQGFGRLIRTATDRGVVAILDPRLLTKGYGKKIRRSLPDAPVIETLAEVEAFFTEG